MTILVVLASLVLVLTKLLDAVTTYIRIKTVTQETNPLARGLMSRLGAGTTILLTTMLAIGIIGLSTGIAYRGGFWTQILFFIAGVLISIIQAAVAHSNWYGVDNFITRQLRIWFSKIQTYLGAFGQ